MKTRTRASALLLLPVVVLMLAVAVGSPSQAQLSQKKQTVSIRITDLAYSVKTVRVKKGIPVSFVFVNNGKLRHEAVIGTHAEQLAHDREMASMGGMEMADEPTAVSVKPGKAKTLVHTFARAGSFEIGCHVPGHYAAGMRINVIVS